LTCHQQTSKKPCNGFRIWEKNRILYVKNTRRIFFLTVCSVPVAFGVNVLRTTCVGVVAYHFGETASHIFHQASGFLTFPLAIAIMFLLAKK